MKHKIKVLVVALMCMLTSGCSTVPQPTMEELLAEVNAEHAAIQKADVSTEQYSQYVSFRSSMNQDLKPAKSEGNSELSLEQAEFDINLLFDGLHKTYGLYDLYGGDKVFEAARQQALTDCKNAGKMNADVLRQIIQNNLSFIHDMHFTIDGENISEGLYPCFFTEISFQKISDGYSTIDGKVVESVDGADNLDSLFKRSLTRKGEIVYWPVTFAKEEEATKNPPSLTIHYSDGSSQTITAQPYEGIKENPELRDVDLYEKKGIPIQYSRWVFSKDFSEFAKELGKEKVSVMNLSLNGGGQANLASEWWQNYLGKVVPTNFFSVYTQPYMGTAGFQGIGDLIGVEVVDPWTLIYTQSDDFVDNENLLIILTGKMTASSAEIFVDMARNVENTLIIGENTGGFLTNNMSGSTKLTYSRIEVGYGNMVTIFPENDFEEGYGFEPDLWCPAVYAEEAAVNFVHRMMK